MHPGRGLASTIAAVAILAACGAPARVHTLANPRDARLVAACRSLESPVAAQFPNLAATTSLAGNTCAWSAAAPSSAAVVPVPSLIVGLVDTSGGTTELEQTRDFVEHAQSVSGIGGRAVYDSQTHTLFVVIADRLWYLQLVGTAQQDPSSLANLSALARDLATTPLPATPSAR